MFRSHLFCITVYDCVNGDFYDCVMHFYVSSCTSYVYVCFVFCPYFVLCPNISFASCTRYADACTFIYPLLGSTFIPYKTFLLFHIDAACELHFWYHLPPLVTFLINYYPAGSLRSPQSLRLSGTHYLRNCYTQIMFHRTFTLSDISHYQQCDQPSSCLVQTFKLHGILALRKEKTNSSLLRLQMFYFDVCSLFTATLLMDTRQLLRYCKRDSSTGNHMRIKTFISPIYVTYCAPYCTHVHTFYATDVTNIPINTIAYFSIRLPNHTKETA